MLPLRKGEYTRIPLTPAARKVADTWDPARDEAAGELCKGYTAAGITRMPGRIRLSWQDDYTMKMELEAGNQTRLFHFRSGAAARRAVMAGVFRGGLAVHAPASAERRVAGDHESYPSGLPAQERRALERQHDRDRVLPPVHRAERRRLAHRRDRSHRSGRICSSRTSRARISRSCPTAPRSSPSPVPRGNRLLDTPESGPYYPRIRRP